MSNKKPFEYIEDKIKLAAENNQPAFDEKAWQGMELLLDKGEKKRRPFLWLWFAGLFLLAGGLGVYQWAQPAAGDKTVIAANTDKKINPGNKENPAAAATDNPDAIAVLTKKPNSNTESKTVTGTAKNVVAKNDTREKSPSKPVFQKGKISGRSHSKVHSDITAGEATGEWPVPAGKAALNESADSINITAEPVEIPMTGKMTDDNKVTSPVTETILKPQEKEQVKLKTGSKETAAAETEKKPAITNSNKKSTGFYVLTVGGSDVGSVKLFSFANSSIAAKYGVGAGYQFNNRWSVQTGFYVTNKKYVAGSGDYHPKKDSYWNMVNITSVRAACLVYEIPLTVKYTFIQQPAVSFYGAVGASSYIMKREDYNYYYTRYDMPYEKYWEYTGNQHLFAALTFSIGIEKKLSGKFSLLAEPSFSIPVSGVGDGKVKLYSSSLLVGFKYFPFKKHN